MVAILPLLFALLASSAQTIRAAPVTVAQRDEWYCVPYAIVMMRGTAEPYGPSPAFSNVVSWLQWGSPMSVLYNVPYPADILQQSQSGTMDVYGQLKLARDINCPSTKYILLGYSQGAAAITNLLKFVYARSEMGKQIAGVLLFGNPQHVANRTSNVDQFGLNYTKAYSGMESNHGGIPPDWDKSGRVMDMCIIGDTVCSGNFFSQQHSTYATDLFAAYTGSQFLLESLTRDGVKEVRYPTTASAVTSLPPYRNATVIRPKVSSSTTTKLRTSTSKPASSKTSSSKTSSKPTSSSKTSSKPTSSSKTSSKPTSSKTTSSPKSTATKQ